MDAVLLPYLQTTDNSARQECLDELLLFHAAPVVRQNLRRSLGFYVSKAGKNHNSQDAEDLYQDVMTKIAQLLHDLRTSSPKTDIEDFRKYVARIASNACNDFLRTRSATRYRLKHNVRDIFSRHPDFAVWKVDDEIVGGFAAWQGGNRSPASERQLSEFKKDLDPFRTARFPNESIHQVPLTRIVAELLEWIDCPIGIDALTDIVALLLGVESASQSVSDDATIPSELRPVDDVLNAHSKLEAAALLERLWQVVKTLPAEQRDTFCFGFEDESGADLFSLLLESGIANLPQIARATERSLQELIRLRSQMPMDSTTIAAELNASRSQIIKWRFRAVRRLKEKLLK
jgi:RNA polymerase sigma factor (sigma-70 family)